MPQEILKKVPSKSIHLNRRTFLKLAFAGAGLAILREVLKPDPKETKLVSYLNEVWGDVEATSIYPNSQFSLIISPTVDNTNNPVVITLDDHMQSGNSRQTVELNVRSNITGFPYYQPSNLPEDIVKGFTETSLYSSKSTYYTDLFVAVNKDHGLIVWKKNNWQEVQTSPIPLISPLNNPSN
ncbi:hypothetical protein A2Z22_00505 [Candidatus Woesebacteria bacterium RBG_16_34_12]|uniref:Uncharacterized protein n=1 Tax=Candidatus Woesebacteria bacterium RBG_16_34_12 TaxID=1802480 RepID=A0A1F7X919_9BACT|nr:MAG: hypothetical protein A2Z22_00505 [Candidatus Woesebacteria bacterium RBG_16_34_12]